MIRPLVTTALAMALGACAMADPDDTGSVSRTGAVAQAEATMPDPARPLDTAMASLPKPAGPIERVTQRSFSDGVRQTVIFAGAGAGLRSNRIELRLRMPTRSAPADSAAIAMVKPTEAAIRAELATEFPGIDMRVVDPPRRNAYGVYGLAAGRSADGAACIYAWQWLDRLDAADARDAATAAALRLRLCAAGPTPDQLASLADQIRLQPPHAPTETHAATPAPARTPPRPAPRTPRPPAAADPLDSTLPAAAFRGPVNAVVRSTVY